MQLIQDNNDNEIICPKCSKGRIVEKSGKFGQFWACDQYPTCKTTFKSYQIENMKKEQNNIEPKQVFTPTEEQQNIFDWVIQGVKALGFAANIIQDNLNKMGYLGALLVEACAGSGKTTTIQQCIQLLKDLDVSIGDIVYLVFNAKNREEAQAKGLPAMTTHQHGFAAIRAYMTTNKMGKPKINNYKTADVCKLVIGDSKEQMKEMKGLIGPACKIISLAKNNLVKPKPEVIEELILDYSIDLSPKANKKRLYEFVWQVWAKVITNFSEIDFDDMLHMPVYHGLNVKKYQWTYVDEIQDMNNCQIKLIKMTVDKFFIGVGDRNQSCYAFRGAALKAMDDIKEAFACEEKTLSYTFRVPKTGVQRINGNFSHIEFNCLSTAKEGQIEEILEDDLLNHVQDGDLVLCRMNAPLVKHVFNLLRMGRKATIIGKDLSSQLIEMIKRFSNGSLDCEVSQMLEWLHQYGYLECQKLDNLGREMQAEVLRDKIETIEVISDGCRTAQDVVDRIETIFSKDAGEGTNFATIHKAKGLEAKRVFSFTKNCPHPLAEGNPSQETQEKNLEYIRDTRFIDEMYLVNTPEKKVEI